MFAKTIIDSDAFLEMPATTQMLYFHLAMRADDEGFVNNPKRIQRMVGAADDDLKVLIAKKFIIAFESGVIVIKHWKIHNYIRKDMYHETKYKLEKASLAIDENNSYTEMSRVRNETVTQPSTQVRLGKVRLGKDNINNICPTEIEEPPAEEPSVLKKAPKKQPEYHIYGRYKNVRLKDETLEKIKAEFPDWEEWIEKVSSYQARTGKTYSNYLATIRNWAEADEKKQKLAQEAETDRKAEKANQARPSARGNFDQREYDDDFYERLMAEKLE